MIFLERLRQLRHGTLAERAIATALQYGGNDGAHHKMWVIDQMVRVLAGDAYTTLIEEYNIDGYEWDTGISP